MSASVSTFLRPPGAAPSRPLGFPMGRYTYSANKATQAFGGDSGQPADIIGTPYSTEQDKRIDTTYKGWDAQQATGDKSIADFTKEYLGRNASSKAAADQENSDIGGYFNGDVDKHLTDLENQRHATTAAAVNRGLDMANRSSSMRRMATGEGSYNDQATADSYGRIMGDAAQKEADLRRQDTLYGMDTRRSLYGGRANINNSYLNSLLAPYMAGQQVQQSQLGNLNALGLMDRQNTRYTLAPPGSASGYQDGSSYGETLPYGTYGPGYGQPGQSYGTGGPNPWAGRGSGNGAALANLAAGTAAIKARYPQFNVPAGRYMI